MHVEHTPHQVLLNSNYHLLCWVHTLIHSFWQSAPIMWNICFSPQKLLKYFSGLFFSHYISFELGFFHFSYKKDPMINWITLINPTTFLKVLQKMNIFLFVPENRTWKQVFHFVLDAGPKFSTGTLRTPHHAYWNSLFHWFRLFFQLHYQSWLLWFRYLHIQ